MSTRKRKPDDSISPTNGGRRTKPKGVPVSPTSPTATAVSSASTSTATSSLATTKKTVRHKHASPIWDIFTINEDTLTLTCELCKKEGHSQQYKSSTSTSTPLNHYKTAHAMEYNNKCNSLRQTTVC